MYEKSDVEQSKKFQVKVEVHQGSVAMDKVTKDARKSGESELLYVNDLVELGDSWEEIEMRHAQ